MTSAPQQSRLYDRQAGYGWLSIALHWIGAILVITLWVLGSSIATSGERHEAALQRHTSFAVAAYLILLLRVVWRFRAGHPEPNAAQRGWAFSIGKVAHYVLLIAIVMMLITGPLSVWLHGDAIHVFGILLSTPFDFHPAASNLMHRVHVFGSNIIIVVTLLHIAGALRHAAFTKDGTLDRILIAAKRESGKA